MKKYILLPLLACFLLASPLFAAAPKVESIGLAPLSETTEQNLQVGFFIEAETPITQITINGKEQKVDAGQRQIAIFSTLQLEPGANLILVVVTDQEGNKTARQYDVLLAGFPLLKDNLTPKIKGYKFELGLHQDDNPSLDMSTVPFEGVTENTKQTSLRNLIDVAALWSFIGFEGEVGLLRSRYSQYHPDLATDRIYLAAFTSFALDGGKDWLIAYQFQDENKGGVDYSMNNLFSTGVRFTSLDQYGRKQFVLLKGNIEYHDFASPYRTDGVDVNLMWDYKLISRDYLYSYQSLFTLGQRNEGVPAFQHSYLGAELHWAKRMTPKIELDLGLDSEYRMYPDNPLNTATPLGSSHVDIPMEISLVTHWQYDPIWRVTGNINYVLSLSNKIPYDRRFFGVTIARDF